MIKNYLRGSDYEDVGVSNIDFNLMRERGLSFSQKIHIDLSVARTGEPFKVVGTTFQVTKLTSGGTLEVSFNKPNENIPMDGSEQWESPFYQFFLI